MIGIRAWHLCFFFISKNVYYTVMLSYFTCFIQNTPKAKHKKTVAKFGMCREALSCADRHKIAGPPTTGGWGGGSWPLQTDTRLQGLRRWGVGGPWPPLFANYAVKRQFIIFCCGNFMAWLSYSEACSHPLFLVSSVALDCGYNARL